MPGVRPIALRALLRASEPSRLRRLSQMHLNADPTQLLDHEPPARRRLERDLQVLAAEARQKLPHRGAISGRHTRALHLS